MKRDSAASSFSATASTAGDKRHNDCSHTSHQHTAHRARTRTTMYCTPHSSIASDGVALDAELRAVTPPSLSASRCSRRATAARSRALSSSSADARCVCACTCSFNCATPCHCHTSHTPSPPPTAPTPFVAAEPAPARTRSRSRDRHDITHLSWRRRLSPEHLVLRCECSQLMLQQQHAPLVVVVDTLDRQPRVATQVIT
jgi:hypothetical protein